MKTIKYELFKLEDQFPMKMYLYKLGTIEPIISPTLDLIYVLEGSVEIVSSDRFFILKEDDFFLNNAYQNHELHSEDAIILICEINMEQLGVSENERNSIVFDCNSTTSLDKTPYKKLKALIASFVSYNLKYQEIKIYANLSIVYSLFAEFMNKYRVISNVSLQQASKYVIRLREIVKYITDHYKESISLKELSAFFGLTVPYLSSFFEKYMSKNFQNYYDEFRVSRSMNLLMSSDETIENIALAHGFTDPRAYVRAFKKIYALSPTEYRKDKAENKKEKFSDYYQSFDKQKYLDKLLTGADKSYSLPLKKHKNSVLQELRCNFKTEGIQLKKSYMTILCLDKASDFLNYFIRNMLEEMQSTLHFKYVQFHGLFADDLHVIKLYPDGYRYSFIYIDQIFDYILSIGLKPIVELSFMPKTLAKDQSRIYENGLIFSEPTNKNDFVELTKALTNHLISRYGSPQVESWPFTLWNGPDTTEYAYGFKNILDFFELYKDTYRALKDISPKIQVGSPSLVPLCDEIKEWDFKFFYFARANHVYPDFLIVNFYSNDFSTFFNNEVGVERLSENQDLMKEFIEFITSHQFFEGNKVFIGQYHFTIFQRNLLSDTIYDSCYIVKNILENVNSIDGFGKWHLTDLTNETQLPNKLFHGGTGFYTYNGIKKPSFYAYQLLSKLDPIILAQGNGYFVTKSENSIRIMFYNYEHYSSLYARGDYFKLSEHSRYTPFESNKIIHYDFHADHIPYHTYKMKITSISKESGSAYDLSERMGLTDFPTTDEIEALKKLSLPLFTIETGEIIDYKLSLSFSVDSLEVKLIEVEFFK